MLSKPDAMPHSQIRLLHAIEGIYEVPHLVPITGRPTAQAPKEQRIEQCRRRCYAVMRDVKEQFVLVAPLQVRVRPGTSFTTGSDGYWGQLGGEFLKLSESAWPPMLHDALLMTQSSLHVLCRPTQDCSPMPGHKPGEVRKGDSSIA